MPQTWPLASIRKRREDELNGVEARQSRWALPGGAAVLATTLSGNKIHANTIWYVLLCLALAMV